MNRKLAGWMITGVLGLLLLGCATSERTVYRNGERTKVKFESATAARLFYEAMRKESARQHAESHTVGEESFAFRDDTRVASERNTGFSQAVETCDFNHDGKITEVEARIFALLLDTALLLERVDDSSMR